MLGLSRINRLRFYKACSPPFSKSWLMVSIAWGFFSILFRALRSTDGSFKSDSKIRFVSAEPNLRISLKASDLIPSVMCLNCATSKADSSPNSFSIASIFSAFYPNSFRRFFKSGVLSFSNSWFSFSSLTGDCLPRRFLVNSGETLEFRSKICLINSADYNPSFPNNRWKSTSSTSPFSPLKYSFNF